MARWSEHPATEKFARNRAAIGTVAADAIRNEMGSWIFVFLALAFLVLWIVGNREGGFDPYPLILLNLILSCIAALQGAILLIAAKRENHINSELAVHTFAVDQENLETTQKIHDLTVRIESLPTEVHRVVTKMNDSGLLESTTAR